jgi:hypothetical protein
MTHRIHRPAAPGAPAALAIAAFLACALASQAAAATCPPGYRPKGNQCMPGPVTPHAPLTEHSNVPSSMPVTHLAQPPSTITKQVDRSKVKPQPGGPVELNPQPIPPGHAIALPPRPGTPLERTGH